MTRCHRVLGSELLGGARDLPMGRRLLGCRRPRYAAWNTAFGWPFVRGDRQAEALWAGHEVWLPVVATLRAGLR